MTPDRRVALVMALRARGIGFLDAPEVKDVADLTDRELIAGLAASPDPRLRNALALLFVRRPELAPDGLAALPELSSGAATVLRQQYVAAVYLQHMWHTRLGLYLPEAPALPDLFSGHLGLPLPDEQFGLAGLRALHARSGFNLTASYDALMALLFDQLRREHMHEPAPAG